MAFGDRRTKRKADAAQAEADAAEAANAAADAAAEVAQNKFLAKAIEDARFSGVRSDGSDNLKASGQTISFYHEKSGTSVDFKAFIMAFNESFNSDWASEVVYGRMDPIMMFKNTTRVLALAFKIPAFSPSEAISNLTRIQTLISFLYPNYTIQTPTAATRDAETGRITGARSTSDVPYAQNISSSPLVRLRVVNFLSSTIGMNKGEAHASKGTLGTISNFTINYNLDAVDGVIEDAELGILPKLIDVNMTFTVLHEKPLGWDDANKFMTPHFPYHATDKAALDAKEESEQAQWAAVYARSPAGEAVRAQAAAAELLVETDNNAAHNGDAADPVAGAPGVPSEAAGDNAGTGTPARWALGRGGIAHDWRQPGAEVFDEDVDH